MPLIIYGDNAAPTCRAVLMLADHLELKVDWKEISLHKGEHLKPEFLKLNPLHSVPVLDDHGTVIHNSHAILQYLASKYGNDTIYPHSSAKKAAVDEKLFFDASYVFPAFRMYVKSLKFLFNQKDNLAVILQMAIFRFIQKFVRFSYTSGFLFGCQFTYFMELPGLLCEARWINLMYTGAIFNMKILTAICMVRVEVEQKRHQIKAEYLKLLDTHITTSYAKVTKVCISDFLKLAQLKVAYINELELWIDFSPRVFVDHYQCWKVLTDLLLDSRDKSGSEPVRLAALGLLKKLILNEDCVRYLKNDAIEAIIKRVADRFEDVSDAVLIKALDVYNSMSVHYLSTIQNQETIYRSMIELIGDSNYEIAKAAGNCLVDLLKLEVADDMELLISLARIANNYHSDKKHFVVEALIEDKSKIFQNWEQFVEFFNNTAAATDMAEKITVSDILVEAVHQTLVGKSTKTREKSREVAVLRETHKAVADCFLPELKMLLFKFREQAEILQNFLKVAMQIDVLEITDQHAQYLNSVLVKLLPKLFAYHENVDCLRAMTEFLLHFSNCDHTKSEFEKLIAVLKQEQADKFLESLETKDHSMIFQQAKKLLVMFERFDMNDHLSWQVCLDCWDQLDETDLKNEFVLYMMQCCRHSLLFKLKKLNATLLPRSQQYESVRQLVAERGEFLGNCFNIMEHLKGDMRKYAWVEVSKTYLDWGKELEKISKQKYFLQNTLPTLDKNQEAMKLYFRVYDKYIVANEKLPNTEKQKYAMFIVNMASFGMFPVTNVDVVFKYYDKMYETYNEVIEKTIDYFKVEPLVGPGLVFSAIKARYLTVLERRGAVDLKTLEAKDILSLTRRFANLNSVKGLAGTILIFSIEYVSKSNEYDFFIYVRPFVDCVPPNKNNELLAKTRASIPAAVKHDSVLYFLNRLIEGSAAPELRPKHQKKTKPPGKALPAALEVETTSKKRGRRAHPKDSSTPSTGKTPQKGAKARGKKQQQKLTQSTESGSSDMSIHDTSDESDEFTSGLENLTLEK